MSTKDVSTLGIVSKLPVERVRNERACKLGLTTTQTNFQVNINAGTLDKEAFLYVDNKVTSNLVSFETNLTKKLYLWSSYRFQTYDQIA